MSISISPIVKLAALAALGSVGLMQGAQHVTFHLPMPAHWGSVLLEPGDYKMFLPDASAGESTFRVEYAGTAIRELPIVTDFQEGSNTSHLELLQVNGSYFVRKFVSGPGGKSFTFFVPKAARQQVARIETSSPAGNQN